MYNLIDRKIEDMFPMIEQMGITLVAYTPLAKGFLSGTYLERPIFDHPEDNRGGRYQFSEEGFAAYQRVLDLIRGIADEKQASMAQIALAWMICKQPWIVPIPGTRTVSRMRENLSAADIALTSAEVKAIDGALNDMQIVNSSDKRIK